MAKEIDCIIVSGAPESDYDFIKSNISEVSYIIAADKGYKKLEQIGVNPDIIVADFDSCDKPDNLACKVYPVEKDATDTYNAVKLAIAKGYKNILLLGALGGRIDHTYSNILCLDYALKNGADLVIADRNNRISLIHDKKIISKEYKWFSLFSYLAPCKGVKISGAHYNEEFFNLKSLNFDMNSQFGQSNYIEDDSCTITVEEGVLLLIETNDYL